MWKTIYYNDMYQYDDRISIRNMVRSWYSRKLNLTDFYKYYGNLIEFYVNSHLLTSQPIWDELIEMEKVGK